MPRKPPPPSTAQAAALFDELMFATLKKGRKTVIAGDKALEVDLDAATLESFRKRIADRLRLEKHATPAQWLAAQPPRREGTYHNLEEYRRTMGDVEEDGNDLPGDQEPAA